MALFKPLVHSPSQYHYDQPHHNPNHSRGYNIKKHKKRCAALAWGALKKVDAVPAFDSDDGGGNSGHGHAYTRGSRVESSSYSSVLPGHVGSQLFALNFQIDDSEICEIEGFGYV